MRIEKKSWPDLFERALSGKKKFDLRLADFDCSPGDTLLLKEWGPRKKSYTRRVLEKKVAFVMNTKT
ncbi:MAG: DUF3850 domain-containing protein [Candidatus Aenigmarchaeota archaeon]|nr:DUF3850 domain-containing protein [Candidatus Aenigmarchaeota archaeon]